ncbi:hypothetical protein PSECIP111951_01859 [Pseudoalteromonas holothuriae]|uniref:N-acetyltransferase domain-containing protein n=1 Tax=Pseudoalteromonas holothuriae TaxID=2963714 RepID=A0A9W4QY39_9GAMM|nr:MULTISPECIES: GNAT family N-acetyltransferase [unclassified Pseudoalteromonas]CAH9058312.1 hypothetical protein PSECIP111854_02177 [Pseudoalteromonas sp. CIP111854]CAH9058355.1 hypothetical protein PSECIP111951_01859 [Pseudoalteromonas sp. CIP111951]
MRFYTPRLLLKPITYRDMNSLHLILNDPLVAKFNDYGYKISKSEVRALIQWDLEQSYLGLGQRLSINSHNGTMKGSIGLYDFDCKLGDVFIGFELGSAYWHQGFMREAINCILNNIVQLIDVKSSVRLVAQVQPQNARSIKLLDQLGFIKHLDNKYVKTITL